MCESTPREGTDDTAGCVDAVGDRLERVCVAGEDCNGASFCRERSRAGCAESRSGAYDDGECLR